MLCKLSVAPNGDVAVAANETSYTVHRYDAAGRALASVERSNIPIIPFTRSELDSAAAFRASKTDQMRASGLSDSDISNLLRSFTGATIRGRFVADGVHHDANGNLWLQRNVQRGASAEADVFDTGARLVATVVLPEGFTIFRVNERWILGQRSLPDDTAQLRVLRNPLGERSTRRAAGDANRAASHGISRRIIAPPSH